MERIGRCTVCMLEPIEKNPIPVEPDTSGDYYEYYNAENLTERGDIPYPNL